MEPAKLQWNGVERSESWRVRHRARAEQCRYLARSKRRGNGPRAPRKCRLCEAGLAASEKLFPLLVAIDRLAEDVFIETLGTILLNRHSAFGFFDIKDCGLRLFALGAKHCDGLRCVHADKITAGVEIVNRGAKRRGCKSTIRESGKHSMPDPRAPGGSNNRDGWIAWGRAMWCDAVARAGRPSAAECDVRPPEKAARPSAVRRDGGRQATRARRWCSSMKGVNLVARLVVVEHARCEPHWRATQRELISLRA